MNDLVFTPTRTQIKELYTPKDLHDCKYVFIRNDAVKKPLCPTYSGPFQVVERHPKYFKLTIKGKLDTVYIRPNTLQLQQIPHCPNHPPRRQIHLQTSPQNLEEMYIGLNILKLMLHINKYFQH